MGTAGPASEAAGDAAPGARTALGTVVPSSLRRAAGVDVEFIVRRRARDRRADALLAGAARAAALAVLGLLVAIIVALVAGALPAIRAFGPAFITRAEWNPVTGQFGALVPIVGTLATSAIAIAVALPVAFGIALFLTELAPPWLRRPLGITIEMLAAIPSIIYGMWGLFVFAPFYGAHVQPALQRATEGVPVLGALFAGPTMGIGLSTAGLILAVMIIPYIAAVLRDVFETVPPLLRESAFALGATTTEVVRHVVLPHSRAAIIGAVMLGLGRALGETMAVTFVIGNAHRLPTSLFMPGNSIASTLANEFTEAVGETYSSALILLGLLLFGITAVVLGASRLLLARLRAG